MLYRIFKDRTDTPEFYLDSPLAVDITKVYEHILDEQDKKDLLQVFNRGGFSTGHLSNEPNKELIFK